MELRKKANLGTLEHRNTRTSELQDFITSYKSNFLKSVEGCREHGFTKEIVCKTKDQGTLSLSSDMTHGNHWLDLKRWWWQMKSVWHGCTKDMWKSDLALLSGLKGKMFVTHVTTKETPHGASDDSMILTWEHIRGQIFFNSFTIVFEKCPDTRELLCC